MKHTATGLTMIAAGFAVIVAAAPSTAQAGGVVDELRSRGLGTWVDRYVEEDKKGNVQYKSSKSTSNSTAPTTTSNATTATPTKTKKTLKAAKTTQKKKSVRKLSKKKGTKKLAKRTLKKTSSTKKVTSTSNKKYKVPTSVKNRLASYGISF